MRLYIDDIRNPKNGDWVIMRSSETAIRYLGIYGCPNYISFDHDLGGDDTAMAIVKWMVERDLDSSGDFIPDDFQFNVHSANVCGTANLNGYLNSYLKQRKD